MLRQTMGSALLATLLATCPAFAQDAGNEAWLPSLMTQTPQEGFDLAVTIARKAVTTTQPNTDALHALRPAYAHDPDSLIEVSGVVATYFATIAEANEYWWE
ncbi:hexameric tyrosine-coordinated heme protein [Salinarimonas ramus]|uniref:Hexameric tyrosine-coordinated heme protein (HTHP) n=1 Tax=Salinarimonas ramus TaxID=690164 RepID=A0A917QIJ9_9HYPH|nr:hexameric tyrosine-coordinated heme protein [Salinarimonas ramus]GGK51491.1 hypothetical protein GCM10011322_43140 [Salinarimonas ramus]